MTARHDISDLGAGLVGPTIADLASQILDDPIYDRMPSVPMPEWCLVCQTMLEPLLQTSDHRR